MANNIKQNDIITYTAQDYANAETVGIYVDYTVFVPYMIVGETAKVKVNHVKRNIVYADVTELTEKSDKRTEPRCKYFGICGGCSLMHMKYGEQLAFKQHKVKGNLRKIGKCDCDVAPCVASPHILAYRNKLSLPVSGKVGDVKIGMYRKGTHEVVDLDNCLLGGLWSKRLVELFRGYLDTEGIAPYNERDFSGEVRHLVARYVDGQLLVTVVSNGEFKHDLTKFYDTLQKNFDKVGLFVNINKARNNVIVGKETRHVAGLKCIEGEQLSTKFRLQPDSFFQVNDEVKNMIYGHVRNALNLTGTEVLVELFSGVGLLTNVLCSDKYDTFAVEIVPSAVQDAEQMARLNNSPRLTNICGDANVELPKFTQKFTDKRKTLVVDPPRKGLGEGICQTVCQAQFDNIAYISCDSATLARDIALLSDCYSVTSVTPYDMFPNTDQVETVVMMARK